MRSLGRLLDKAYAGYGKVWQAQVLPSPAGKCVQGSVHVCRRARACMRHVYTHAAIQRIY